MNKSIEIRINTLCLGVPKLLDVLFPTDSLMSDNDIDTSHLSKPVFSESDVMK